MHDAHRRRTSGGTLSAALVRMGLALLLMAGGWGVQATMPTPPGAVRVLELRDAIGPASADYVVRGLAQAAAAAAPLVVIGIDTPGGLDTSMRQIIQAMLASPVPVVVYVGPEGARAASAGTYILYAAHIAAMAPATTLGAATPVAIGLPGVGRSPPATEPADPASSPAPGDAMTAKQVHDAAAFIRGLAQQHGRNAEWAERAVREAVSLTAEEALREGVIDVVAADLHDLLARIDGRELRVRGQAMRLATRGLSTELVLPDARQRLLSVIAHPGFALVLMMIGIYGLIFEFSSPGFGVPGTVGAICLLLALFALQMLPVNYAGVGLILLGVALLAAELMVPSFGVLGVGGIVAFIAGGLLLFDRDVPGLGLPLPLILGLAVTTAAVVLASVGMALRSRRRAVVSGAEELASAAGVVLATDATGGWALVHGERWRVKGPDALSIGQRVHVTGRDGLVLAVRPDPEEHSTGEPR